MKYISGSTRQKKLIAAHPIVREGFVIKKIRKQVGPGPIDAGKEVQVGYYHIIADTIEEAISIAKENPEFEYVPSEGIEVMLVKMKEEKTNFVYPK